MAKKLGKALIFTALASAAAAGGMALYNKYKASTDDFDDDFLDFDDEEDDLDDDLDDTSAGEQAERGYVSIPREDNSDNAKSDDYKVNVDVSIADNFNDDEEDDDFDFISDDDLEHTSTEKLTDEPSKETTSSDI